MKKVKDWIYCTLFAGVVLAILSVPVLRVYAIVTTCGWKGLFVECRISETK